MKEIRIASLACLGDGGVDASLKRASAMIAEAAYDRPDVVCLPELFAWVTLGARQKKQVAEQIHGKSGRAMGKLAARHGINLLAPLLERSDDRIFNSMAWFDRKGKVAGVYRKAFPTDYEMTDGISPGPLPFDVFQTEFGPIGCCICFDLNYREVIERIAAQGCRLVIVPTMFDGLSLMSAWAKLYRMYFLSVAAYPYGAVVDPLGTTLVEPWQHGAIHSLSLNLDYVVLHTDHNSAKFPLVKKRYGSSVEIENRDNASCALLVSKHSRKTASDMVRECRLECESDYLKRSADIAMSSRGR